MASGSDSASSSVLLIIAGILGGFAALLLITLLARACYWRRVKRRRHSEREEFIERFSLQFLSKRLDESMSGASNNRPSISSSTGTPRRDTQTSNARSDSLPTGHRASLSESTRSYGNISVCEQDPASSSTESMVTNRQYRPSVSSDVDLDLPSLPTVAVGSDLTRPYAFLHGNDQGPRDQRSATSPRHHYSHPTSTKTRAETLPANGGHHSASSVCDDVFARTGQTQGSPGLRPMSGYRSASSTMRTGAGIETVDEEEYTDMTSQKAMSRTASRTSPAENSDEYTDMTGPSRTSKGSPGNMRAQASLAGSRHSSSPSPIGRVSVVSGQSNFSQLPSGSFVESLTSPAENCDEYTDMSSLSRTSKHSPVHFRRGSSPAGARHSPNGRVSAVTGQPSSRKLSLTGSDVENSTSPAENCDEYTPMSARSQTKTQTPSPKVKTSRVYQNIKQLPMNESAL